MRKREPGKLGAKWERRYFVLYGKLKYYDSRSLGDEKGSDLLLTAYYSLLTTCYVLFRRPSSSRATC